MPEQFPVESTNQSACLSLPDRDTAANLNPFVGTTCLADTAANVRAGLEFLARTAEAFPNCSSSAAYGVDLVLQAMAKALAFETKGDEQ